MLTVTDVSATVFDRMINRGGMALTFGVPRAIVRDRYVSTDPVYARAVIEFGRKFHIPQPVIAALVRLEAVGCIELKEKKSGRKSVAQRSCVRQKLCVSIWFVPPM